MGNLCGKSSKDKDPFASEGRTLGSAPPAQDPNARTSIPNRAAKKPPIVGGPNRTVGAAGGEADESDPRDAARRAAEARASRANGKGQLSQKLAEQKRQTGGQALAQASREERGARDQDAGAAARAYN